VIALSDVTVLRDGPVRVVRGRLDDRAVIARLSAPTLPWLDPGSPFYGGAGREEEVLVERGVEVVRNPAFSLERPQNARRPELATGVHSIALRTIERWYAAAGGDGIYTRVADDRLSFRRVVPHTEDIERLVFRRHPSRDPTGLFSLGRQPSASGQGNGLGACRCWAGRSSRFHRGSRASPGTASMPEWASRRATAPASSGRVGACSGHLARATASATNPRSRGWGGSPRSRVAFRRFSPARPTRNRGDGGDPLDLG
jgi:hypothetical protein